MLRTGLLDGLTVAFAGEAVDVAEACAALGAATPALAADPQDEEAVAAELDRLGTPDTLVCATAPAFSAAGGGLDGLRTASDAAFIATRTVANRWIAAERGGKVILLAPGPDAAPLRASLENLARTLSVEWARFGIRPTAILPGTKTSAGEVAQLVAFLASRAGDYYSGCAFTLA
jgi:NAD(P)-dependent dehydrogenase (short-subunit alcohol dehydrogenase family)